MDEKSFLSKKARIPKSLLNKDRNYLLAVLIAFIIDEGNIDSTCITIKLRNIELTKDLCKICNKLGYKYKFTFKEDYGNLYILRDGMKRLYEDYKILKNKYPEVNMYKIEERIKNSFEIYSRNIYKTKGNKEIILKMLKKKELTVNQIASEIKMTRQGVRFHIHNLENENKLIKTGFIGKKNIIYRGVTIC